MRRAVSTAVLLSCQVWLWFSTPVPAWGQPILERLEQKIREGTDQTVEPAVPVAPGTAPAPPLPTVRPPVGKSGYLGLIGDDQKDRGRGVRVLEVRPGSAADKGGLRKDDLINGLAGVRVRQMTDLVDILTLFPPGETLSIDFLRDTKQAQTKVTLGHRPQPPTVQPPTVQPPTVQSLRIQPTEDPEGVPLPPADPPKTPKQPATPTIAELLNRIEQLERRVAALEQATPPSGPQ